jgi:hypothetical protein
MYNYFLTVTEERFGLWIEVAQLIGREEGHCMGVALLLTGLILK